MRELVYLSQAKLQQFRKPTSKRDGLSGGVKLTAGLTGLPAVEANVDYAPVAAAAGTTATLDQAEEFIRSKWPVRWWTEDLEPGEWIQFETKLAFGLLTSPVSADLKILFFWGRDDTDPSIQLLLHGSPRHLIQRSGGDVPAGDADASMVAGLFRYLQGVDNGAVDAGETRRPDARVARVVRNLREIAPDVTAGWLSGLARVTFSTPGEDKRVVVASPLVVEHVPAPR